MKQLLIGSLLATALVACGGGGGTNPGPPVVTPTPGVPQTYSMRIKFNGGATLRSQVRMAANGERVLELHPLATSQQSGTTQLPVEVAVAPPVQGSVLQPGDQNGLATVVINPQPTTSPNISVQGSGIPSMTVVPTSGSTSTQFAVSQNASSPTSGSLTATASGSVNTTVVVPVYAIQRSLIVCGAQEIRGNDSRIHQEDQISGLKFVGGVATATTDPTQADVYADGPNCTAVGTVNLAESEVTFHFPHGASYSSSPTQPFATLSAITNCTNTFTSQTYTQLYQGSGAVNNPTDIVCIGTGEGHPVALAISSVTAPGYDPVYFTFDYKQAGSSLDGF